ncbi:MAG: hypothetical protein AB1414_08880 [bacterium]
MEKYMGSPTIFGVGLALWVQGFYDPRLWLPAFFLIWIDFLIWYKRLTTHGK